MAPWGRSGGIIHERRSRADGSPKWRRSLAGLVIDLRDRFLGCLVGGAVGDALGAPYEGLWSHSIPDEEGLLAEFGEYEGYPRGQYSDDTQLTVATVEAIVGAGEISPAEIAAAIAKLWKHESVIGPGGACTRAAHAFLKTGDWTTCGAPVGQAGNGTAMRTVALGLYFIDCPESLPDAVADVSRITHRDPRSVAGGVAVAKAGQLLAKQAAKLPQFFDEIASAMAPYDAGFAELVRRLPDRLSQPTQDAILAISRAGTDKPDFDAPIITPFVIPSVLASLWCLLRYPDSWASAVVAAIRLGGDVDTLGAIVGSLAGIRHGFSGIPGHLAESVVNADRLQSLALRYYSLVKLKGSGSP